MVDRLEAGGWGEALRTAPAGVVAIAAVLGFLAGGIVLGGFYIAFSGGALGYGPAVYVILAGPAVIYLALHLLRLSPWAWLALVGVTVLLLLSSIVRVVFDPAITVSPLIEALLEAGLLSYLLRPAVRRAFGRG